MTTSSGDDLNLSPAPHRGGLRRTRLPRGVLAWVVVTARLLDPQHRSLVVGVVGIVVAIAFEAIAVATAMPVAARELHGVRSYGLAFSLFLTTSLVGMVLAGIVCDRRGPVGPFLGATVAFVTGLAVAGTASSMAVL